MIRSDFIKYAAALAATFRINPSLAFEIAEQEFSKKDFGDDFFWGVSTSAYQIEGAFDADGKGESIWDRFTSHSGNVKDRSDGRVANDFYHRYGADLELLKSLNFENFRFSFSWSRLMPDGTGKINEKGIEYSIHVNGPGELVAEAAMFNEKRFPASCAALEDTLVVYIPRDAFIALILKRPKLSLKFMSAYSKRLREFVKQVEDLSGSNIKQRLAKYILSNIDKNSSKPKCILSMTKKELSSSLGTIPETLSRALADLKKKAYIETLGKEIIVKDIKGLKSLV